MPPASRVECEQPLPRPGAMRNWIAKNGLPPVFLVHQLRQRTGAILLRVQRIGHESAKVVEPEGRQHDVLRPSLPALRTACSVRMSG